MNITNNIIVELNELHNNICNFLHRTVGDAIKAGELLTRLKQDTKHGEFLKEIENNFQFNRITAFNYMRVYEHRNKCLTVEHLQEAYKQIRYIEKKKRQQKKEKIYNLIEQRISTGKIPENWNKSCEHYYRKKINEGKEKKEIENKKKKFKDLSDDILDKIIENELKKRDKRKEFAQKISEGNEFQDNFFNIINRYIENLNTDTEKMEALQNIIKFCRRQVVEFHKNYIEKKEDKNEKES